MISDPTGDVLGRCPGLADEVFEHDGLVTKRTVRAAALAHLRPRPGHLLWDLGTGAGSIAIEWVRAGGVEPLTRAIGVERRAERATRARANAARLSAPGQVEIVQGDVSALLPGLPAPDAVFIGGGVTAEVLNFCLGVLPAGGRLVAHAVSLEGQEALSLAVRHAGGGLSRIAVENLEPLGGMVGWKPARAVVQWAFTHDDPHSSLEPHSHL